MGLVVSLFRVYYRVRQFFRGLRQAFAHAFGKIRDILEPPVRALVATFGRLFGAIAGVTGIFSLAADSADASAYRTLGSVLGTVLGVIAAGQDRGHGPGHGGTVPPQILPAAAPVGAGVADGGAHRRHPLAGAGRQPLRARWTQKHRSRPSGFSGHAVSLGSGRGHWRLGFPPGVIQLPQPVRIGGCDGGDRSLEKLATGANPDGRVRCGGPFPGRRPDLLRGGEGPLGRPWKRPPRCGELSAGKAQRGAGSVAVSAAVFRRKDRTAVQLDRFGRGDPEDPRPGHDRRTGRAPCGPVPRLGGAPSYGGQGMAGACRRATHPPRARSQRRFRG